VRNGFTDSSYSKVRTRDMGGVSTTHEFTKAILDKMETI
jgi:isocitrate dehydrogenase (NAD+)